MTEGSTASLTVDAGHPAIRIDVLDGKFKSVARGYGRLADCPLPPGIYLVRYCAADAESEVFVTLEVGKSRFLRTPPTLAFTSPAPLNFTSSSHERHQESAFNISREKPLMLGDGAQLFVFVRDVDPELAPIDSLAHGLTLHGADGKLLISLDDLKVMQGSKKDGWAGRNLSVDRGVYRLRLAIDRADTVETVVHCCPGWQSQIFLLREGGQLVIGERPIVDLPGAAQFMTRIGEGFDPISRAREAIADPALAGHDLRLVELARTALENGWRGFHTPDLEALLAGDWRDPIPGIFGLHALLLGAAPDMDLADQVLDRLRAQLGDFRHPDVEALALEIGRRRMVDMEVAPLEGPPMLRRSWDLLLAASADRPSLIPANSLSDQISDRLWGRGAWLVWRTPEEALPVEAGTVGLHWEQAATFVKLALPTAISLIPLGHRLAAAATGEGAGGIVRQVMLEIGELNASDVVTFHDRLPGLREWLLQPDLILDDVLEQFDLNTREGALLGYLKSWVVAANRPKFVKRTPKEATSKPPGSPEDGTDIAKPAEIREGDARELTLSNLVSSLAMPASTVRDVILSLLLKLFERGVIRRDLWSDAQGFSRTTSIPPMSGREMPQMLAAKLKAPIAWKAHDPQIDAFLDRLQGNILKGHGRNNVVFMFCRFRDDRRAQALSFLKEQVERVPSAKQQLQSAENKRATGQKDKAPFVSILLTKSGYDYFGVPSNRQPPDHSFQAGMGAAQLNDPPQQSWDSHLRNPHLMILVAVIGPDEAQLEATKLLNDIGDIGDVQGGHSGQLIGNQFFNDKGHGIENFGYVDGRSQPLVLTEDIAAEGGIDIWPVQEFPVDQFVVRDPAVAEDSAYGSYFVFRQLEQDVRGFKTREDQITEGYDSDFASRDFAGVGRLESGTPFEITNDDHDEPNITNNFVFMSDPPRCPHFAHIRKVNPRTPETRGNLMIRRGITYGTRNDATPKPGDPSMLVLDDTVPTERLPTGGVGLLFQAYQANIKKQFETTQGWANSVDNGVDPVIGQAASAVLAWPVDYGTNETVELDFFERKDDNGKKLNGIGPYVRLLGGGYFFAPSLPFLQSLVSA